jgi:hypothetical protein
MSLRRPQLLELERHVMRCRRREEAAALMLAAVPVRGRTTSHRLACCYRMTDSVAVARVGRHCELVALFDDDDGLDRGVLETRLHAAAGVEPAVAWARFPDDGVTLDALLLVARLRLRGTVDEAGPLARPAALAAASGPAAVDGK